MKNKHIFFFSSGLSHHLGIAEVSSSILYHSVCHLLSSLMVPPMSVLYLPYQSFLSSVFFIHVVLFSLFIDTHFLACSNFVNPIYVIFIDAFTSPTALSLYSFFIMSFRATLHTRLNTFYSVLDVPMINFSRSSSACRQVLSPPLPI